MSSMTKSKYVVVYLQAADALEAPINQKEMEGGLKVIKNSMPEKDGARMQL